MKRKFSISIGRNRIVRTFARVYDLSHVSPSFFLRGFFMNTLILPIFFNCHNEFCLDIKRLRECKIVKVREIKTCELLEYWIECPPELEQKVTEMGCNTFILKKWGGYR